MSRITTYGHVQSACYSGALVWHPISLTRLQMRMRLAQRLLRTGGWVTIWPSCAWAWRNPWGWASLVSRRLEICGSILSSAMSTTGHLSVSSGEASCAAAAGPSSMSIQDFYNAFTRITWQLDCMMLKTCYACDCSEAREKLNQKFHLMDFLVRLRPEFESFPIVLIQPGQVIQLINDKLHTCMSCQSWSSTIAPSVTTNVTISYCPSLCTI